MLIWCLILCAFHLSSLTDICSGTETFHYATKTAYRNRHPLPGDWSEDEEFLRKECTPVQVTHLFRHGTRYPSTKQIRKVDELHARLVGSASGRDYLPSLIHGWKNSFKDKVGDKSLSVVGEEEMVLMGQRFWKRYESRMMLVGDNFHVITSDLPRAKDSSMAFLKGLKIKVNEVVFHVKEKLVRFFAYCNRYRSSVKKNKTALAEYYRFKKGPEVAAVVSDIRTRFQLNDIEFGADDVELIFVMCGFEIANNVSSADASPWCQMFYPAEAKVLEYLQDVRQYWRKSHAYDINILQSCPLVSEIIYDLHEAKLYWDRPGTFMLYFGHAETIIPLIGLMGLLKQPDHLRANNFDEVHSNRTFRTSAISPFGANLAIELYRCSGPNHWEYFVRPLVNEAPVLWNLCNRSFCPYEEFRKLLARCEPGRYDHDETCGLPSTPQKEQSTGNNHPVRDEL